MYSAYLRWTIAAVIVAVVGLALYGVVRETRAIGVGKIVVATGSPQYFELAESYRRVLERYGVQYEVERRTEGFATLRALLESGSSVNAGFLKGGLIGSMQGRFAVEKAKGRYGQFSFLLSVGRVFHEPIWVFTRGDLPIASLADLKGRKILTGTRESGTRRVTNQLLKANGIDRTNATLIAENLPADAAPLLDGSTDAAFLIEPVDSDLIQQLLRVTTIRLMDFTTDAEAYANRFPAITTVVLRRGAIEFNPPVPSADMVLLNTTAALVVRADMHPGLVSLLTLAVINNPKGGFDKAGDPVLFHRAGQFPSTDDAEFQIATEARAIYKSGELPFVLRNLAPLSARLGIPSSAVMFVSSYGGQVLLLMIPLLAVILPVARIAGTHYQKYMLRRLLRVYQELRALERMWESGRYVNQETTYREELNRMAARLDRLYMPSHLRDHLLDLRERINFIRDSIESKSSMIKVAAE